MNRPKPDNYFQDWKEREALAEAMIPMIGKLYRESNVKIYMYGWPLINRSVIEILKAHRAVRQREGNELSEFETFPLLDAISKLNLGTAHIDLGKLAVRYMESGEGKTAEEWVATELADLVDAEDKLLAQPQDVVLYGFGRIGRLLARLLIEKTGSGDQLRLKAIVVRKGKGANDLVKRASLLRRDSVHGSLFGVMKMVLVSTCKLKALAKSFSPHLAKAT